MVHYNKYCPHCHKCYKSSSHGGEDYEKPLQTCRFCGKSFIDKDCIEPFFAGTPKKLSLGVAFLVCLFPFGLLALLMTWLVMDPEFGGNVLLAAIPAAVYILLSFTVYARRNKFYEKQCKERKESYERLLNREYVQLLMVNGCYVSQDFLLREHPELLRQTPTGQKLPESKGTTYTT